MIKKTNLSLLILGLFQIFLLMNMGVAHSYVIHQTDLNKSEIIKTENNLVDFLMNLLINFLKIKQIGIVSADILDDENQTAMNITGGFDAQYSLSDISWNCCPEMKDGSICQDIASITPEICAVSPLPTTCANVAECKIGCCVNTEEGLCITKSPQQKCELDGGEWKDDINCLIPECQKGCCVLGNNVQFITPQRCELLSSQQGFEKDFRDLTTEIECLALLASQFEGACIIQGTCSRKTESECSSKAGEFYKDYLCSHPILETECERQTSISCAKGKDEIYWFDSCGNMENIYSADKDASWNNGKFLTKSQSCNSGDSNINSQTCGNCGTLLSSRCSETKSTETHVQDGDFVCKDLKCRYTDEWGNDVVRENGESWCAYEGFIGDGKDTVGSRHWKKMCINGEIKVEGCADYRGAVCAQTTMEENGKTFSIASCVMNEAMRCLEYGTGECNENKHCMIKNINVDTYFTFDICVPRYPRGFDLRDSSKSSGICSMASQECTVYYAKEWDGDWECQDNCNCEEDTFSQQMNDLCISLGDCGSYVNYIGDGTTNIGVSGGPSLIPGSSYQSYSNPVEGQYVVPQDIDDFLSSVVGTSEAYTGEEESDFAAGVEMAGTISGALGAAIGALAWAGGTVTIITSGTIPAGAAIIGYPASGGVVVATKGAIAGSGTVVPVLGSIGAAAAGAAIGFMAGAYFAQYLGRTGTAATVMSVAGGVAGATIGLMATETIATGLFSIGAFVIYFAIAVMLYVWLSGWGETEERTVSFTCHPWQAPVGGDRCEECNNDESQPCTQYKCESLGQACKILNERINTENPICKSIPYENRAPIISADKVLTEGYEFKNEQTKKVEIRANDGECIPEFTQVLFNLKTDEYAQCKYSFEQTLPNYEDMPRNYPLEQNAFTTDHGFGFLIPSLDSLSVYDVTGDLREMFGNMNMYVRCQDAWGNFNAGEYIVNFCINSGPDLTPARIVHTPSSNSFLKYGTTETNLTIYLNEPAECKYDLTEGKTYDEMSNSMQCKTGLTDAELFGWACSTILTNLTDVNNYYIKCKDKPWVQTPEDIIEYQERNINQEDFVYSIYITETELEITSTSPSGKIESGFAPASIDLEVETSGGFDNGKSTCYYEWAGNWVQFLDTFEKYHEQPSLTLMGGIYDIPIKCEDDAGNIDYGNVNFNLDIDTAPPVVVRAYKSGSNLRLITDEPAECYYDFSRCNFNMDNATSMTTALSVNHYANWITGQTYYIKCGDIWENTNPNCAIIVKASSLD